MAREESGREGLLHEATALTERIELVRQSGDHVTAGFRSNGAFSIFFGEDPVYQFNTAGEVRRAYCNGLLFKAVRGQLVSLTRERHQNRVQLLRHDLSETEQAIFLAQLAKCMRELTTLLDADAFEVAGQVPPYADVLSRVRAWLAEHQTWHVAPRPNA